MTFQALLLILRKQVSQKWARFLLASGGIMIGIWAITLTSSLSFGLSDTIVRAINSQPFAKEFTIGKYADGGTNPFNIASTTKPVALSLKELENIKNKYPAITDIQPEGSLGIAYSKTQNPNSPSCTYFNNSQDLTNFSQDTQKYFDDCNTNVIKNKSFYSYYENNKANWIGKTSKPNRDEMVACFRCGGLDFYKTFGVTEPNQLIGKEFTFELNDAPRTYKAGEEISFENNNSNTGLQESIEDLNVKDSQKNTVKIVAVIDDRGSDETFSGVFVEPYLDFSYFSDAIKSQKNLPNLDSVGFIIAFASVDSYQNLKPVLDGLRGDSYFAFSLAETLIGSVQAGFNVLTIVLSGFGFIALVASIFGIVNVMTISVLERRKEIGVLKSLGARDMDIFKIFFLESAVLGFIGWLGGTLLGLFGGFLISTIFKAFINSNSDWKKNLEGLNIDNFSPSFPWWLLLGTLAVALFFTTLSGIFPAIRAGRQNPVEVLRSE
jgi:ABC-type antimicrobial peptide transport system permease subunit